MLRRDDGSVLRVDLDHEVCGKRKRERPKKTWKKQMEEEMKKIWSEKGECPELRKVEKRSASNCTSYEVNPTVSAKETIADKN